MGEDNGLKFRLRLSLLLIISGAEVRAQSCPSSCTSATCTTQCTGSTLWGLSRISLRTKPLYNSDTSFTFGGKNCHKVLVYVLANGIYDGHSEFEGRASCGHTSPSNVAEGNDDMTGFGTHVAALIAGKTYGVAKNASVISVKILNRYQSTTFGDVMDGINWACNDFAARQSNASTATRGVAILSLSFQTPGTQIDETIAACLALAGLPFIVPAGDRGLDTCSLSPARSSVVLTVAGSTIDDELSNHTGYGGCVDIVAPSTQILSATIGSPTASAVVDTDSSAAALVTGAIAQYLAGTDSAQQPTTGELRSWLKSTGTPGVISIPQAKNLTPNLLLYAACQGVLCANSPHCAATSGQSPAQPPHGQPSVDNLTAVMPIMITSLGSTPITVQIQGYPTVLINLNVGAITASAPGTAAALTLNITVSSGTSNALTLSQANFQLSQATYILYVVT